MADIPGVVGRSGRGGPIQDGLNFAGGRTLGFAAGCVARTESIDWAMDGTTLVGLSEDMLARSSAVDGRRLDVDSVAAVVGLLRLSNDDLRSRKLVGLDIGCPHVVGA